MEIFTEKFLQELTQEVTKRLSQQDLVPVPPTPPRMRTAAQAYRQIKQEDPGSDVTESQIRRLVKKGIIKSLSIDSRILIDYDELLAYLRNPTEDRQEAQPKPGIRPIY